MMQSAGQDHVIFSKKLLLSIGNNATAKPFCLPLTDNNAFAAVVFGMTLFLFFTVEQSRIAGNLAKSRTALAQTNSIKNSNSMLEKSKSELEDEEQE
jgi:hypothetical protein